MARRALCAVGGFLGICLSLSAQQIDRPNTFSALNNNSLRFPSLMLSDGGDFSFGSVAETNAPDFLPSFTMASVTARLRDATAWQAEDRGDGKEVADRRGDSKEAVNVQRSNPFDYVSGEIGFLYGRSTGKFGREVEAGYILGEVGNDKFSISAGALFEHSSGRFPRFGR
jgi:hypothetical protein